MASAEDKLFKDVEKVAGSSVPDVSLLPIFASARSDLLL